MIAVAVVVIVVVVAAVIFDAVVVVVFDVVAIVIFDVDVVVVHFIPSFRAANRFDASVSEQQTCKKFLLKSFKWTS